MKRFFRGLRADFRLFFQAWWRLLFAHSYRLFSGFEGVKKFLARGLYRQRGRFSRPFVHTAMGGIVALSVTLAPVLASSFPGADAAVVPGGVLGESVMEVSDDTTRTVVSDKVRDKVLEYKIQDGDTLSTIADKFDISVDTIRWENNLSSIHAIKPGQVLKILPVTGIRHVVGRGETIYTIAKKYGANSQAIVDFPFNTFADNETFALAVGQDLIVPEGEKPDEVKWSPTRNLAQLTPNAGSVSGSGSFAWPMSGVITQGFSWYHRGIDIATGIGTPVLAADAGRVAVAGWPDNSGYGNRVVIDHGNGYQTWYAHLSRIDVVVGQTVKRGDRVGLEGSTGRSTGPHLHFEIRLTGKHQSPLQFLGKH